MEHRTEGGVSRGRRDIAVGCLVFAISIGIGIGNGHARRAVRLPLPGADGTPHRGVFHRGRIRMQP